MFPMLLLTISVAAPIEVQTLSLDWKDSKRDLTVPVKVHLPKGDGPFPIVIFSHGLGGSRDGYSYLGQHWATHGYISVHPTHIGSDTSLIKGKKLTDVMPELRKATTNPANLLNRPRDVSFIIDELTRLNDADGPFKGKCDLKHIGIAGHSFGAYTTMAIAGQVFPLVIKDQSFGDDRVKCAIAMSSQPPNIKSNYAKAYGSITMPIFHMTGTKDDSPIQGDFDPKLRRVAFDEITKAEQFLLVFKDGDHMVFSGRARTIANSTDERYQSLILQSSTAFWDAYLKGDDKAKSWLKSDFAGVLKSDGTFEKK